ncbi:MAG TPA: pilus assembly protein TadD [Caulobacteraceae bacterium]|jgi:Flp pilus assembly protein TadD|nr:pilus assembly protein TadD [Caulobacteraceae bacterium]
MLMPRAPSRTSSLAATALVAVLMAPAAGRAGVQQMIPVAAPASTPAPASAPAAATRPQKAGPQARADAARLEPLARAAFWGREAQIDPTDIVAAVQLASALRDLGQFDSAVQSASHALVIDPNNMDALMETARDYIAEDQGFYAIDPLAKAQALAPKDWRPLSLLGIAYAQVRRLDDAQVAWRQALALSPDNPAVLTNMAMQLAQQGDAASAEALLRRAAAQPGANLTVRQDLTLVLGLQGKLGEAETLLRRDLPPDQADADLAYLQAVSSKTVAAAPAPAPQRTWDSLKAAGG